MIQPLNTPITPEDGLHQEKRKPPSLLSAIVVGACLQMIDMVSSEFRLLTRRIEGHALRDLQPQEASRPVKRSVYFAPPLQFSVDRIRVRNFE